VTMRFRISAITVILFFTMTSAANAQWIEAKSTHYSIFYQPGFEKDAEFTRKQLDRAEDLEKSKYGLPFSGFYISFYLQPAPMEFAGVGLANLQCCAAPINGVRTGTIHYLAPSAPAWSESLGMTSLGLPKDENYHAKVMMSEYITIGHYVVQDSRTPAGGWRYRSAPEWFVQGLQEYDGIFHTTDANRDTTKTRLFAWARNNSSTFKCCASGLQISDIYNGGATFIAFLAAEFGEGIHSRLLRETAPDFETALANQTKPYTLPNLFSKFEAWLASTAVTPQ